MSPEPQPETFGHYLAALATYLHSRRQAILDAWRAVVLTDPVLETASKISVLHFEDIAPQILDSFERRLRAGGEEWTKSEEEKSFEHGAHRWQEGYSLREMVREWGHFQACVMEELDQSGLTHRTTPAVLPFARRLWLKVCTDGICNSVDELNRLQKQEAESVFRDLQQAVTGLQSLDRQRAALWHEAAHDLRGNVGLVTSTTSLLTEAGVPDGLRAKAFTLLQASVDSLQHLLEDLLGLARLEAGRETLHVQSFDAGELLRSTCEALELPARDKGLYLKAEGPESLPVEGDPAKLRRILQNLILNALKYTREGGITISWGPTQESDIDRWSIRIEDTGPGMPAGPGGALSKGLLEATKSANEVEERSDRPDVEPAPQVPPSTLEAGFGPQNPGEGIGLLIVKRLCELLHAGLEVSSEAGKGTVFQVVLPRDYGRPSE
ncbi:MAG TPA: sensor histidine kinase [Thermoanaerobaculia bacterium]|nr:sensor histidine kinase [Thermoanaerobaculia bacterium]